MAIKKVVIDTNVYISAIFWGGKPREVVDLGRDKKIHIFTSPEIDNEISEKLIQKFNLPQHEVNKILSDFSTFTTPVSVKKRCNVIVDDPDDDKFVECAVECHADFIISGDRHLLKLKEYEGIKMVNPAGFLSKEFPNLI